MAGCDKTVKCWDLAADQSVQVTAIVQHSITVTLVTSTTTVLRRERESSILVHSLFKGDGNL